MTLARSVPIRRTTWGRALRRSDLKRTKIATSARTKARRVSNAELTRLCRYLVVELRDENACQRCGKTAAQNQIQWAHVKAGRAKTLTWTDWASLALCSGCHFWYDGHSETGRRWWAKKWPDRALALGSWQHDRHRPPFNAEATKLYLIAAIQVYDPDFDPASLLGRRTTQGTDLRSIYHDQGRLLGYGCPHCDFEITGVNLNTARAETRAHVKIEHGKAAGSTAESAAKRQRVVGHDEPAVPPAPPLTGDHK